MGTENQNAKTLGQVYGIPFDTEPTMQDADASLSAYLDLLNAQTLCQHYGETPLYSETTVPGANAPAGFNTLHISGPPTPSRPMHLGVCDTPGNRKLRDQLRLPANEYYRTDSDSIGKLYIAIESSNAPEVKSLLLARVDPNGTCGPSTVSPLFDALEYYGYFKDASRDRRCEDIVKYLIFAGARLDGWFGGRTPLMIVADKCQTTSGSAELLSVMLELGPASMVNASSGVYGKAPLYRVVEQGRSNRALRALEILLQFKADPDLRPAYPDYMPNPFEVAMANKDHKAMEYLLQYGANADYMNWSDQTLLFRATLAGDINGVSLLLKYGADADMPSPGAGNELPIHEAAKSQRLDAASLLLKSCKVNVLDVSGMSPLGYAIETRNQAVILALLDAGADPNVTVEDCETGWRHWVLHYAIATQMPFEVISALVDHRADVNSKNWHYETRTIHHAIALGRHKVVRELLVAGADMEVQDTDYSATPLSLACRLGQPRTAKLLVERGADVNAADWQGMSYAEEQDKDSFKEVKRLLLERGAQL